MHSVYCVMELSQSVTLVDCAKLTKLSAHLVALSLLSSHTKHCGEMLRESP